MNNRLSKIANKLNKKYYQVYLDYLMCKIKYNVTLGDYLNYEFYNLNNEERKSYLTYGINLKLINKYNNGSFTKYLDDSKLLKNKFHRYLNYNFLYLNNFSTFKTFIEDSPIILADNKEYKVNTKNYLHVYQELIDNKVNYLTSYYDICKEFKSLEPDGNVFIRFLMLKGKIVNAYLFIKYNNTMLFAPINLETGIVDYPATNNKLEVYDKSPITNESIIWFKIPRWPRVKRYVEKISEFIPEVSYATFDITLTTNSPILIAASSKPKYTYYQLSLHRSDKYGIINTINKIRKEEK